MNTGSFQTDLIFTSGVLTAYVLILAFVLGSVFGSFINCMAWRIAHGEKITGGRSHCTSCGHVLGPLDLVPIFSYLFLRGRCRYCHDKISPRYMITELLLAVTFLGCILRYGLGFDALRWMALSCCLLGLSLVDLETYLIPDRFLIAALVIYAVTLPFTATPVVDQLKSGIPGALILCVGMLLLSLLFDKVTGKESLGGGDIKLYFVAGLYLGPIGGLLCLILSCVIGLVFSALIKQKRIPFGPSISAAILLTAFFGSPLINWYAGLLGF